MFLIAFAGQIYYIESIVEFSTYNVNFSLYRCGYSGLDLPLGKRTFGGNNDVSRLFRDNDCAEAQGGKMIAHAIFVDECYEK